MDGTGFAASSQFDSLSQYYNLVALNIPVGDRSSFAELVQRVVDFLEAERDARAAAAAADGDDTKKGGKKDAEVYLMGESMGGLLSLGVAQARPDLVDRLILVNPASSYDASPWPAVGPLLPLLPTELYAGLPYALAPVLFDSPRWGLYTSTNPVDPEFSCLCAE